MVPGEHFPSVVNPDHLDTPTTPGEAAQSLATKTIGSPILYVNDAIPDSSFEADHEKSEYNHLGHLRKHKHHAKPNVQQNNKQVVDDDKPANTYDALDDE